MSTNQHLGIGIVATNNTAPAFAAVQGSLKEILEAQKKVNGLSAPMDRVTKNSSQLGMKIQSAGLQIGDFAVQVGGGTDAARALAQQLPQLLGGFGAFGAVAGAAFAILMPLAMSLVKTRDYAKELTDGVDNLDAAQKISTATIASLTEEYGRYANVILAVAKTQEELAKGEIVRALVDQARAISDLNEAYIGTSGVFGEVVNQWKNADFGRSAFAQMFGPLDEAANKVNFLKDKFSLTESAARGVVGPYNDFQVAVKNTNTEAAAAALEQFNSWIQRNGESAKTALPLLNALREQFSALARVNPGQQVSSALKQDLGVLGSPGETVVHKVGGSDSEAVKAAAAAAKKAAGEFKAFIDVVSNGVTPLQHLQDTLRQAQVNFGRFGDKMKPEQVVTYTAYIADLNKKIDEVAFKDRWDQMAKGIQTAMDAMTPFRTAVEGIGRGIEDSFVNGLSDAFTGFVDGTESAKEALKGFAATFLQEVSSMIVKAMILYSIQRALGMVQGSVAFGSVMQSYGGVYGSGMLGGARASGGPVVAGKAYLVGEKGPEALIPNTSGTIIPNDVLTAGRSKRSDATSISYSPSIVINGNADQAVIQRALAQERARMKHELPRMIRDERKRGRI